jgi:KDO2-lipid IV(A) lauroyltransferase
MLPMRVLHVFSTGLYYLLYRVIGYRKKVVFDNLERSFPEKSKEEIEQIGRAFYRHLCDLIFESIRMFSMGEEEIRRRSVIINPEFIRDLEKRNKSVILVAGHYNSWEMEGVAFPLYTSMPVAALYSPIKNRFLNKVMTKSREKHGLKMIPKHKAIEMFSSSKEPTVYLFGADQSPSSNKKTFWMDFLNQDTAIAFGTEKLAKEYDCIVIYGNIKKVKRSHYTMTFQPVTYESIAEEHGEITRKHVRILEEIIRKEPQYWLWTHRRWKRKRKKTKAKS